MAQVLLAYISSDFSDGDVDDLRSLVEELSKNGQWSQQSPRFVEKLEEDSRSRPEDEPVKTVGLLIAVSRPGELPATSVDEVARIVDWLAKFSEEHGVDFELQLEDTYVGEIRGGLPDRLVREGLLAQW